MFDNKSGEKIQSYNLSRRVFKTDWRLAELLQRLGFYLIDVQLNCVMVL